MKKINKKNNEEKNEEKNKKIILIIIAIIIIILALITSCSCTSKFWGRIGNLFSNKGEFEFKEKDGNFCEYEVNKELKFDTEGMDITVTDDKIKLSFSTGNLNPKSYTCRTSDASIATCYVDENGYVVVIPKKPGTVTVIVSTDSNGKTYEGTTEITINETSKNIILSNTSGTMDLSVSTIKQVIYKLKGISGKVNVTSSDEKVATATAKNGVLRITGIAPGKANLTLSVDYNGRTYQATYTITVTRTDNKPNPDTPGNKKDSNSSLKNITTNRGKLSPAFKSNIKNYKIELNANDKDITLTGIASSNKATVTYTYNGKTTNSFKDVALNPGTHIVTINIKAEDGSTSKYNVTIIKPASPEEPGNDKNDDATLQNLTASPGGISPVFNKDTKDYEVNLSADDKTVTIVGSASSSKSKVTYTYNGNTTDDFNNIQIEAGTHIVTVTVVAESGRTETYTVKVIKPEKKSNDASLKEVKVNDVVVTPDKDGNYTVNAAPGTKDFTISALPNHDKAEVISYTDPKTGNVIYTDTDRFELKDLPAGTHNITVTVKAEDGTEKSYTITINIPSVYTVTFEPDEFTCKLENKDGCALTYIVKKDGVPTEDYDSKDIIVNIPEIYKDLIKDVDNSNKGYILLKPDTGKALDKEVKVEIKYKNDGVVDEAKVTFTSEEYKLSTEKTEYYVSLDSASKNQSVILNTNMFPFSKELKEGGAKVTSISGGFRIESKNDPNIYIDITSRNTDLIKFSYTPNDDDGYDSLPIKITALKEGTAYLQISGSAYGRKVKDITVVLNITYKYILTLDANGGTFNATTNEYQYKIGENDKLYLKDPGVTTDLDIPDIPILVTEDKCSYYEFIGYAPYKGKDAKYTKDDVKFTIDNIITYSELEKYDSDNDGEVTLVAVYDLTVDPIIRTFEEKTMWLVDVPLFHNEQYYKEYGVEKMIYPGATGEYTMYFKNTTPDTIKISGLILKEDTICFSEGCLNMGYIVKDSNGNFLYGDYDKVEDYWVLNYANKFKDSNYWLANANKPTYTKDWANNTNKLDINFSEKVEDGLTLTPGTNQDWAEITIHWRWVELNDNLDTKIGTHSANTKKDTGINDLYKLYVGIKYKVINEECQLTD